MTPQLPKIVSSLILSAALLLAPAAASAKRATKAQPAAPEAVPAAYDAPAPAAAPPEAEPAAPSEPPARPAPAVTAASTPAPDDVVRKRLGVGYKIGNGWGFVGGDVIVSLVDHVTLDLQLNYLSWDVGEDKPATGWAYTGELQLHLKEGWTPSFYLGLGISRGSLSLRDVSASGILSFANVGYDIRLPSGLGILIGAGVGHIGTVHAQSATTSINVPGETSFNLEAGLRFMFL